MREMGGLRCRGREHERIKVKGIERSSGVASALDGSAAPAGDGRSSAEPAAITERADGAVEVKVHQVGRDLAGSVLFDEEVRHIYAFRGDLVQRMTIEQ